MWGMYPAEFLALLENLLTDGMTEEERKEWNEELCAVDPSIDEADPMLLDMIRMGQASDVSEAAELMRLFAQLERAEGNESKTQQIRKRINEIRAKAMEARAQGA